MAAMNIGRHFLKINNMSTSIDVEFDFIHPELIRHKKRLGEIKVLCKSHVEFSVFSLMLNDTEHTVILYLGSSDHLPPDNIWQRIIIGPPVGYGTDIVQDEVVTLAPVIVINNSNEHLYKEFTNTGCVIFKTHFGANIKNGIIDMIKSSTVEEFFHKLGEEILENFMQQHHTVSCHEFLLNEEEDEETDYEGE